jgi:HlyD family secretion protein
MKHILFTTIYLFLLASCAGSGNKPDATGTFEATEIIVSAQGAGQIMQLQAAEGATLQAGETVGLIDTTDLFLQKQLLWAQRESVAAQYPVLQAQADVQRQQLKNLEKDFARVQNMLNDGAATQKQYDDIDGAMAVTKRQIAVTESQRAALRSQQAAIDRQTAQLNNAIAKCRIDNPQQGTVLVKYVEAGEIAVPGKALFKVADMENIVLRAYVTSGQLTHLKIGQAVKVFADFGEKETREYQGSIAWISEKSEFTPKTIQTQDERANLVYAVKIAVKNDGYLKIGMYGQVTVDNW